MQKQYKVYDFIMALFVTVLLLSNLLSSAKIIDLNISIGALPLVFDGGTLVFPISYIFGDILTEVYGFKRSRRVIWMGFFATILMGLFLKLVEILPGEPDWQANANFASELVVPGQAAYDAILGGVSGLIVASLLAYFFGEFINSYVLAKLKIKTNGRWLALRTIGSTVAGQAVDSVVFFAVAIYLGVFQPSLFWSLVIANYIFKVGLEVILTPVTIFVVNWVKRIEGEDVYDKGTDFNPFKLDV